MVALAVSLVGTGSEARAVAPLTVGRVAATSTDRAPNVPTVLSTAPATTCQGIVSTIGDGDVQLRAAITDPDGDQVGATFSASKGGPVIASGTTSSLSSGSTATYDLPRDTLDTAAGGAVSKISWKVQATDFTKTSGWSATCSFNFDPTRTLAPTVKDPGGEVIGKKATFTITPPATGVAPSRYTYQLSGTAPVDVPVIKGQAPQFSLIPTRFSDALVVTGWSAGGNAGDSDSFLFNASGPPTAADSDLTGDGIPDLFTVGGTNGIPSGLWLADGKASAGHSSGNGQVIPSATDLGQGGNGFSEDGGPGDFDGSEAITGHFTGSGPQDTLIYFPAGADAGGGEIFTGNETGSAYNSGDAGEDSISSGTFTDNNGDNPILFANAGVAAHPGNNYPDLIAINGDSANGYYLDYYPSLGGTGAFDFAAQLSTPAPDGTMNWKPWTIATSQSAAGTSMFLWNTSTHALYLWQNPIYDADTATFSIGTQYLISSNWNPGTGAQLRAADINGDGTPDLWATTAGATATAYLITKLSTTGPATVTAQPAQTLITPTHTWQPDGYDEGTATDGSGNLYLVWNSTAGEDESPFGLDANLNGSTGALNTTAPALTTNANFTASAWVMPSKAGGVVLSQEGVHATGLYVAIDSSSKQWTAGMAQTDTNSAAVDSATGPVAKLGVWSHITVTFKASTGLLTLYVNGVEAGSVVHTPEIKATGQFHLGDDLVNGSQTGYFDGRISDIQIWKQTLTAAETAQQCGPLC